MEEDKWEQVGSKGTGTKQMTSKRLRKKPTLSGRLNSPTWKGNGMKPRFRNGSKSIAPPNSQIGPSRPNS